MKTLGLWLVIFGIGSIALNMMNLEFKILMWIDNWGRDVGLLIRGGLTALGVALFVMAMRQKSASAAASAKEANEGS